VVDQKSYCHLKYTHVLSHLASHVKWREGRVWRTVRRRDGALGSFDLGATNKSCWLIELAGARLMELKYRLVTHLSMCHGIGTRRQNGQGQRQGRDKEAESTEEKKKKKTYACVVTGFSSSRAGPRRPLACFVVGCLACPWETRLFLPMPAFQAMSLQQLPARFPVASTKFSPPDWAVLLSFFVVHRDT
jgi:hypothetical protein